MNEPKQLRESTHVAHLPPFFGYGTCLWGWEYYWILLLTWCKMSWKSDKPLESWDKIIISIPNLLIYFQANICLSQTTWSNFLRDCRTCWSIPYTMSWSNWWTFWDIKLRGVSQSFWDRGSVSWHVMKWTVIHLTWNRDDKPKLETPRLWGVKLYVLLLLKSERQDGNRESL